VEAGDLISRLRLDTTGFQKELTSAQKEFASAFGTMATGAKQSSEKAAKSTEASAKRQKKAAQDVGRSWWASFGRVALGFTVAYRAMNAFERGVQELTQTISGAIRESGELAAVQAKLAFWYKMHSQEAVSYADAFDRAAVNVNALAKASLTSVSFNAWAAKSSISEGGVKSRVESEGELDKGDQYPNEFLALREK